MSAVEDRDEVVALLSDAVDKLRAVVVTCRDTPDGGQAIEFQVRVIAAELQSVRRIASGVADRLAGIVDYLADLPIQKDSFAAVIRQEVLTRANGSEAVAS